MDFLSNYSPLALCQYCRTLTEEKEVYLNPLGVTQFQVKKVKRLLTGRLMNKNLTFMQAYQNPQNMQDQSQNETQQKTGKLPNLKMDISNSFNFSLIQKTNIPAYQILINFYINIKRSSFCFDSVIMNNYKIVKVQSRNITKFMARYFISSNAKFKEGSFYINPLTKEINFLIQNNSVSDRISSLLRNPQKFLGVIVTQIDQIILRWNEHLQTFLYIMNKRSYEQINTNKKLKYIKGKLVRMSQMILHSHIDASFFYENKGIPRFKKMQDKERNEKIAILKSGYIFWTNRVKQHNAINQAMKVLIGKHKIDASTFKFPNWDMPQIKQISGSLACMQYSGKIPVYSQIEILNVERQWCIFQSGFSKIYMIDSTFKRQGQTVSMRSRLIKKQTQQKRYQNEIQILKLLKDEKCLFFPRYYFCQQEEHKQSIIIEYIPQSSIDRYLSTKSTFIGYETKLFFLFEIIIALRFLRDNNIVHIDLKPQNVLVKIAGDAKQMVLHYLIKLIDFGQSYRTKIDDTIYKSGNRGFTIPYAPPQLLSKRQKFDEKTDVYSFGIIMYEFLFDHLPIQVMKLQKQDFIDQQYLKFFSHPVQKLSHYGTQDIINSLYLLCLKCLQPEPSNRPTLDWLSIILKDLVGIYEELTK